MCLTGRRWGPGWELSCLLLSEMGGGECEECRTRQPSLWGRSKVVLAPSPLAVKVVTIWSPFILDYSRTIVAIRGARKLEDSSV